jgi:DNA-binding CsgD family transcriptional regulator
VLRSLFGLTPAEAATVGLLANGQSAEEIAACNRIGIETVRTHIKRSMAKLGVGRQAELVAVVMRGAGISAHVPYLGDAAPF